MTADDRIEGDLLRFGTQDGLHIGRFQEAGFEGQFLVGRFTTQLLVN